MHMPRRGRSCPAPGVSAGSCRTGSIRRSYVSQLLGFEAVPVGALLLQGAYHPFHHAVLMRAVRADELLAQAVAAHQMRAVPAGEHKAVVRAQQERHGHPGECVLAGDQRVFQGSRGSAGIGAAQELLAEQLAGVTVDQRQRQPASAPAPDPAQARGPTRIRCLRHRTRCLDCEALVRPHACAPASP